MKRRYSGIRLLPFFDSQIYASLVEKMPTIGQLQTFFTKKRFEANGAVHFKMQWELNEAIAVKIRKQVNNSNHSVHWVIFLYEILPDANQMDMTNYGKTMVDFEHVFFLIYIVNVYFLCWVFSFTVIFLRIHSMQCKTNIIIEFKSDFSVNLCVNNRIWSRHLLVHW